MLVVPRENSGFGDMAGLVIIYITIKRVISNIKLYFLCFSLVKSGPYATPGGTRTDTVPLETVQCRSL